MTNPMKAPTHVIAPEGCAGYLTPNKRYAVRDWEPSAHHGGFFHITRDDGTEMFTRLFESYQLGFQDWIIPDDEAEAAPVEPAPVNDGGPAFPGDSGWSGGKRPGMSLRAYAACHAMAGMLASEGADYDRGSESAIASAAVAQADALLAALKGTEASDA